MPTQQPHVKIGVRKFRFVSNRLATGIYGLMLNTSRVQRVVIVGVMLLGFGIELHLSKGRGKFRASLYPN